MTSDRRNPPESPAVSVALGVIEVIKAAIWPAIVLGMFWSLYQPLRSLLTELPNALGRADVVSVGDFKIQLTKAVEVKASADVREALKGLDSEGTERVLRLYTNTQECEFKHPGAAQHYNVLLAVDRNLENRKLLEIQDRRSEDNQERDNCYMAHPTDLGKRTRDFLLTFLGATLRIN